MTIQVELPRIDWIGNGFTKVFTFSFTAFLASDIDVYVDSILQNPAIYIITLNADQIANPGGEVDFDGTNIPASGARITFVRVSDLSQLVDYIAYDPFPAETHEGALDKLTQIDQEQQVEIDRSVKVPFDDDGTTDYTLPAYDAGKAIAWDETDRELTNSDENINDITTLAKDSALQAAASAVESADSATESAASAVASETSAAASLVSEANALNSENKAQLWAEEAEDVPVEPGEFSAFHWAKKSENSALGAAVDISFDDTSTTVKGINVQVFNESLDIQVEANRVQVEINRVNSEAAVQKTGDTMTGDLLIEGGANLTVDGAGELFLKDGPALFIENDNGPFFYMRTLAPGKAATIQFVNNGVNFFRMVMFPLSNNFFMQKYNNSGVSVLIVEFNDGFMNISAGGFRIANKDIFTLFIRTDADSTTAGNLTFNKIAPIINMQDTSGTGDVIIYQRDVTAIRNMIAYDNGQDKMIIEHRGPSGTIVLGRIEFDSLGNVNIETGNFQVGGVDVPAPGQQATIIGMGEISAAGVILWGTGLSGVVLAATGIYDLTLSTPEPDTDYIVTITSSNPPLEFMGSAGRTTSMIQVVWVNGSSNNASIPFTYKIERLA